MDSDRPAWFHLLSAKWADICVVAGSSQSKSSEAH
jgi:hypothetical protein